MRLPFNGAFPITQIFGVRKENYARFNLDGHNGIDFGAPKNTPVLAPHAGKVLEAAFDKDGYGNYVKIENGSEGSVLAHLETIKVQVGFQLSEGDLIGYSGSTGNSTAPHLHWGYYPIPRNRENGENGFIDQMELFYNLFSGLTIKDSLYRPSNYIQSPTVGGGNMIPQTKYHIGDEVRIVENVPVGAAPGQEKFSYGKVGLNFPAKIIGIMEKDGVVYYNVEQTYIGGGTGWANAEAIDKAKTEAVQRLEDVTNPTPNNTGVEVVPMQPSQPTEEMVKKSDYLIVIEQLGLANQERDRAIQESKDAKDETTRVKGILAAFTALGYSSADELTKDIQKKDETIIKQQAEMAQILNRNSVLATELAKKDKEDATAIEEAMDVVSQAYQLKNDLSKIAETVGTKPKLWDILGEIENIKKSAIEAYNKAVEEIKRGREQAQTPQTPNTNQSASDWLLSLFNLK